MKRRTLTRWLPLAAVLLLFYAGSCKPKPPAPGAGSPPAGTPGTPAPLRSFAPVPTRVPITHLPGQPTPLPELPG
ncbi:MAG TPA: hypothetical protein VIE39_05755 [Thermoanaerobaculia bacterium]